MPLYPNFTVHRYVIKFQNYNESSYLIPFGDIHRNAKLCHEQRWKEFLDWAKTKKNAYFLGMGDYNDLMSESERKSFNTTTRHDTTQETFEDMFKRHTDLLIKELSFMKGRLIGMIEGNHFATLLDGTTTTQMMCRELGCKYLGTSSFIRLAFEQVRQTSEKKFSTHSIDIWAHHGKGASRLVGGSLNTVQQMAEMAYADIFLMGHDHKKSVAMSSKLRLRSAKANARVALHKQVYARTGSFLRAYVDGAASYVARKALNPTDLGVVKIELTPKRKCVEGIDDRYIDIHASI